MALPDLLLASTDFEGRMGQTKHVHLLADGAFCSTGSIP